MTDYHPDTDREIVHLYAQGNPPETISDELAIPLPYVLQHIPTTHIRQQILNLWHKGIGKREISATVLYPLAVIQVVIAQDSTHQRRPPRTPDMEPGSRTLGRIERLLAEAEASPRHRTRQLAARARATITDIVDQLAAEDHARVLQARVDRATRELQAAREALKTQTGKPPA